MIIFIIIYNIRIVLVIIIQDSVILLFDMIYSFYFKAYLFFN